MQYNLDVASLPEGFRESYKRRIEAGEQLPVVGIRKWNMERERWEAFGFSDNAEYAKLIARAVYRQEGWRVQVWTLKQESVEQLLELPVPQ